MKTWLFEATQFAALWMGRRVVAQAKQSMQPAAKQTEEDQQKKKNKRQNAAPPTACSCKIFTTGQANQPSQVHTGTVETSETATPVTATTKTNTIETTVAAVAMVVMQRRDST